MWWRVWVLWRDSRVLHRALAYICGGVLLSATFSEPRLPRFFPSDLVRGSCLAVYAATGVIDTRFSCKAQGGFMYEGLLVGSVASMLSLGTNLAATTLTAYKAWCVSGSSLPPPRKYFHRAQILAGSIGGVSGGTSRAGRIIRK